MNIWEDQTLEPSQAASRRTLEARAPVPILNITYSVFMFSKPRLSLTNLVTYLTPKHLGAWESVYRCVTWGYGVMKEKASVCFPVFHLKTVQKLIGFEGALLPGTWGVGQKT